MPLPQLLGETATEIATGAAGWCEHTPSAVFERVSFRVNIARVRNFPRSSALLGGVYGSRFAAPLDGAVGGRPGRYRCRPAGLYAPCLQLHGIGARAHRDRGLC